MQRLKEDVYVLRERRPELPVVLLADGAPELWNLFSQHLNGRTLGVEPMQLVDVWHVLEYVAAAARLLEARGKCAPGMFRRWKAMLLEGADGKGARDVLQALEATDARKVRDAEDRQPVNDAIRYLENRSARMDYAGARARGLAIDSGAVEATCKSLVAIRMKRAGSRWKTESGNEVLALRALQLSDWWQEAISGVLKPLVKSVRVTRCARTSACRLSSSRAPPGRALKRLGADPAGSRSQSPPKP
jgi:hypothetical protein